MKEIPVKFTDNDGCFSFYTVLPKYFYITATYNGSSPWGLIQVNHEGIELCTGVTSRIAEIDSSGKLKIIGVDIIEQM